MENSLSDELFLCLIHISEPTRQRNDELFCSLKNELREVDAQISVHSEKLLELIDQKKELSSN